MNNVQEIFQTARAEDRQPISFEIFPPKGTLSLDAAREVASQLAKLSPDFISVTYSAGGSDNKAATADIAAMIQDEFSVCGVAHLTCAAATKDSVAGEIQKMKDRGIGTVLALRGDLKPGQQTTDFHYAKELIPSLVDAGFCVGAACYPEGHIACDDLQLDVERLKQKQDAGASFLVTQLFYDNESYYRFRERAEKAGITLPITCGIMPFLSKAQITRMVFTCGASLPSPIIKLLYRYEDSPEDLRKAGIEYACGQLVDLAAHGVDGLHVYTMNHPDIAEAAVAAIRGSWEK